MTLSRPDHDHWMAQALASARRAEQAGEVPVGAVLVYQHQLVATAWNQPIANMDPTAHAEIQVLRLGARHFNNYRLGGTTLYVTLEPCMMCLGAMVHARIAQFIYGASDPKSGVVDSVASLAEADYLNHRLQHQGGVMKEACGELLRTFFQKRR